MLGDLQHPPIVIRASARKTVLRLLGSLAFVGLDALLLSSDQRMSLDIILYLGMAFFGLIAVLCVWHLLRPPRLTVSQEGVRYTTLWGEKAFSWDDVVEFVPTKVRSTTFVGLNYSVDYRRNGGLRKFNSEWLGVDGTLPVGWEVDPPDLCDLLNRARSHWKGAAASSIASVSTGVLRPRSVQGGRMGRKAYWIANAALAAVFAVIAFVVSGQEAPRYLGLGLVGSWGWIATRRLHDIGKSGWLVAVPVMLQIVVFPLVLWVLVVTHWLEALGSEASVTVAIYSVVAVEATFTIWLGLAPGHRGPNKYGPPPGQRTGATTAAIFE